VGIPACRQAGRVGTDFRGSRVDLDHVKRILVRGVNWVGDTILTYPTIEALKKRFPNSQVAVLVPEHLIDLWKTSPYVDEIIPLKKKGGVGSFFEEFKVSRSLRKKFDLGLILPRSFHSAFQVYLAGIPVRIGYEDEGRFLFLTHRVKRKGEVLRTHRIHYYRKLMEPLGQFNEILSPRLHLGEEDRRWTEERLKGLGLLDGRPLIGINPGAAYGLAKCWYPDRFAELGRRLSEKWKATIIIFGRKEEQAIAKEIMQSLGNGGVDLTGETRLLQLAALLERCRLLVTNDTGTMHMAAAVGTSVVAIFGSTDPVTTGPWGDGHVIVRREVSCSPCLKRVCPADHRCMDLITVDEVEEVVDRKLKKLE
jgi:heptosyltransferase-2